MPVIPRRAAAYRGLLKIARRPWSSDPSRTPRRGKVFDELDTDGTATITAPQLRELLQRVTAATRDDGMTMVLNHAQGRAPEQRATRSLATAPLASAPGHDAVALPKDAVLAAVSKFRYYLQRVDRIDRIFAEFDTNKSGGAEPSRSNDALQNLEDSLKGSSGPRRLRLRSGRPNRRLISRDRDVVELEVDPAQKQDRDAATSLVPGAGAPATDD
ncbi:hypothetical protein JL721_6455 [Aureococcus anophagefferens]|nr:hypothetical protein JL721_6455 [Aureococcus anophagefferens]